MTNITVDGVEIPKIKSSKAQRYENAKKKLVKSLENCQNREESQDLQKKLSKNQ